MSVYLLWVSLIILALTAYSMIVWNRSAKTSRFQARLTILFLLFILVPSVPLTLLISAFFTENTELFLLPGIERTLEKSQETIRQLVEERAKSFFQRYPEIDELTPAHLEKRNIAFVGLIRLQNENLIKAKQISNSLDSVRVVPDITVDDFKAIISGEITSLIRLYENSYYFEVFYPIDSVTVKMAGYWIDSQVVQTRDQISVLQRIHKFKEKVVEPQLIWAFATVFVIILALLAIWAARKFSKGISEPILQLASGMKKVAAGDLNHQVKVLAKDEIKLLIDSFNKMTADLHSSRKQLVKSERVAAWRDVARRVSHEIKNPLTPIQIALYRLRAKIEVPEKDRELFEKSLQSINEEIDSLRRLAAEFSQYARLPQAELKLVNINEIIRSVVILFEAEPQNVKLVTDLAEDIPRLPLDREQIKRVLNNLLKNGVEASASGSSIIIKTETVSLPDKKIQLSIIDHGDGVTPAQLEKMFDPYFTTKKDGMGIGLPVVKRIIEDHEGEISISSKKGIGTEIKILL